jgi:hypothetical protein
MLRLLDAGDDRKLAGAASARVDLDAEQWLILDRPADQVAVNPQADRNERSEG